MKKVLLWGVLLFTSLSGYSQKLPPIIKYAVKSIEANAESRRGFDSVILTLDTNSINNLTRDTLMSLLIQYEVYTKNEKEKKEQLNKFLLYNPEYSNYNEIKNIKEYYYYRQINKYYDNIEYMYLVHRKLAALDRKKYNKLNK